MATSIVLILVCAALPGAAVYEGEVIFPAMPLHSHSASIVETPGGDLLAAWFHGRGEKTDDTLVIEGARKRKGATSWSEPFILADNQDLPDQNPVLFIDPKGALFLFWISSLDNSRNAYELKYRVATRYSADGPPEWEWNDVIHCRPKNLETIITDTAPLAPEKYGDLFDGESKYRERLEIMQDAAKNKLWRRLGWMPRCQPIMLSENRMMLGLYSDIFLTSIMAFTEDGGKTWEYSEPIKGYGLIQPALVQKKNGDIVAYGRDKSPARKTRVAESKDGGMTWSFAEEMEIRNPDSSVSCIVLKNGNWLLVCNDLRGRKRHGRGRLTAFLSDNEGVTWTWRRVLEDTPDDADQPIHASYPTVIQTRDGLVHCVYTYTPKPNETIKHVFFNEEWIRKGPIE
jgi:predicted neuraminidase